MVSTTLNRLKECLNTVTMNSDLIAFYQHKVTQQLEDIIEKDEKITELTTIIFELLSKDCPEEYKAEIKKKVFGK